MAKLPYLTDETRAERGEAIRPSGVRIEPGLSPGSETQSEKEQDNMTQRKKAASASHCQEGELDLPMLMFFFINLNFHKYCVNAAFLKII